jgi:hypothetical protein
MKYLRRLASAAFIMLAVGFAGHSVWAAGAIAYDNATSADTSVTTTTLTFAHTVAVGGTNRVLFVGVVTYATSISSATYNGTAMTLIDSYYETYNNTYVYLYYLVAPATGPNNVIITIPSPTFIHATASSYTGASQTGIPDATAKSTGQAQNYSQSLNTAADNSWAIMIAANGNGRAVGAGTGTTLRGTTLGGGGMLLDSNGPVTPTGSKTLIANGTYSSDYWATVIVSFPQY